MRHLEPWSRLRPGPLLVTFLLGLAVLLAGQNIARYFGFRRPLQEGISAIAGVKDFALQETPTGLAVEIKVSRVADLEETAEKILAVVRAHTDRPVTDIVFLDRRPALKEAYYELRFALEEAMSTGNYSRIRPELDRLAQKYRLTTARVYPGRDFIYVQLESSTAYLYEALPRKDAPLAGRGAA